MRAGAEYFTSPALAAQRRYEALRACLAEEMPAAEVAVRLGCSTASVMQMANAALWEAVVLRRLQAGAGGAGVRRPGRCASACLSCAPRAIR